MDKPNYRMHMYLFSCRTDHWHRSADHRKIVMSKALWQLCSKQTYPCTIQANLQKFSRNCGTVWSHLNMLSIKEDELSKLISIGLCLLIWYLLAANDLSPNDQMEPSHFYLESAIEIQQTEGKKVMMDTQKLFGFIKLQINRAGDFHTEPKNNPWKRIQAIQSVVEINLVESPINQCSVCSLNRTASCYKIQSSFEIKLCGNKLLTDSTNEMGTIIFNFIQVTVKGALYM